jgi:hypothetical protein
VPEEDQATIPSLEVEVRLVHEFKDDEEIEQLVGGLILDLGCTRIRNSKFLRTLELYWNTKTMVALGMLSKEYEFSQLKHIMETLEEHNPYLLSSGHLDFLVSWWRLPSSHCNLEWTPICCCSIERSYPIFSLGSPCQKLTCFLGF